MKEASDRKERIIPERGGKNGEILYLIIHNPEMLNALSIAMQTELIEFLKEAAADESVSVIILRGYGDKAFTAGGVLSDFRGMKSDEDREALYRRGFDIGRAITGMDKPVIAAISGYCVGGGFEIAMCCDLVYASDDSSFSLPEINIGLVPGWGGAIRLPRILPLNRAKEMIYLGERLSAGDAYTWGIVNRVFPKEQLFAEVDRIAEKLLSRPPLAVRGVKRIVNSEVVSMSISEAQKIEKELTGALMHTRDFEEAVEANEQRRKPRFRGE